MTDVEKLNERVAATEKRLSNLERAFVALLAGDSDTPEEEPIEARHRSAVLPRALAFMREASEGD